jgi:hypothetical protein
VVTDITVLGVNVKNPILSADHLINKDSNLYSDMKVVLSLTTIPSRIEKAIEIANENLMQGCHEIWLNIPYSYTRFPSWSGKVPEISNPKIVLNRCPDYGPATKVFGPALLLQPEDLIVYIDDDTHYDIRLVTQLMRHYGTDKTSAWGLSGFNLNMYFQGYYPREHGQSVDVIEGYGGVIVKAEWIQKIHSDFITMKQEARFADDIVISNLLQKIGVKRRTVFVQDCHIGLIEQKSYGFDQDALHHQVQGGHKTNYMNVLINLQNKGENYFDFRC